MGAADTENIRVRTTSEPIHVAVCPEDVQERVQRQFVADRAVRVYLIVVLPTRCVQPKRDNGQTQRTRKRVPAQGDFVLIAQQLAVAVQRHITMRAAVKTVKRVVPVCVERCQIGRVHRRELDCAENIVANREVTAVVERIDIAPAVHVGLERGKHSVHRTVAVGLGAGIIAQSVRRCALVGHRKGIAQHLHIFEVESGLVVELVAHPPNNALAVGRIGPSESGRVVVEGVLDFPRPQLAIGEVGVPAVQGRSRALIQMVFIVRHHDDVKRMPSALGVVDIAGCSDCGQVVSAVDGGHIVRDAIGSAGDEIAAVPKGFQRGVGDFLHPCGSVHGFPFAAIHAEEFAVVCRSHRREAGTAAAGASAKQQGLQHSVVVFVLHAYPSLMVFMSTQPEVSSKR